MARLYGRPISSNAPVSESMMNPLTTTSFGTSGWVRMVSTVLRTEVGVFNIVSNLDGQLWGGNSGSPRFPAN